MEDLYAQLTSVSTTLDDLIERITSASEKTSKLQKKSGSSDQDSEANVGDQITFELYEVERTLRAAARKMRSVLAKSPL